jgi:hypothetical protein
LIEVVSLAGEIVIGPGVNVADTPSGTLARMMCSQVTVAVCARVGATMATTRTSAAIVAAMTLLNIGPQARPSPVNCPVRSRVQIVLGSAAKSTGPAP